MKKDYTDSFGYTNDFASLLTDKQECSVNVEGLLSYE